MLKSAFALLFMLFLVGCGSEASGLQPTQPKQEIVRMQNTPNGYGVWVRRGVDSNHSYINFEFTLDQYNPVKSGHLALGIGTVYKPGRTEVSEFAYGTGFIVGEFEECGRGTINVIAEHYKGNTNFVDWKTCSPAIDRSKKYRVYFEKKGGESKFSLYQGEVFLYSASSIVPEIAAHDIGFFLVPIPAPTPGVFTVHIMQAGNL